MVYSAQGRNQAQSSWFSMQTVYDFYLAISTFLLGGQMVLSTCPLNGYPQLFHEAPPNSSCELNPHHIHNMVSVVWALRVVFRLAKCCKLWLEHRMYMRAMSL